MISFYPKTLVRSYQHNYSIDLVVGCWLWVVGFWFLVALYQIAQHQNKQVIKIIFNEQIIIFVFHYYNIYTLLCASTSCFISHDVRASFLLLQNVAASQQSIAIIKIILITYLNAKPRFLLRKKRGLIWFCGGHDVHLICIIFSKDESQAG